MYHNGSSLLASARASDCIELIFNSAIMAKNSIRLRRIHAFKKGESPSSMKRYRNHVKKMGGDHFFKELNDINDECGGNAKMRALIKVLTDRWKHHKQRLPLKVEAVTKRVGVTRQRLPLKEIIEKIVDESQSIAKNIDEGTLIIVSPIEDSCESD